MTGCVSTMSRGMPWAKHYGQDDADIFRDGLRYCPGALAQGPQGICDNERAARAVCTHSATACFAALPPEVVSIVKGHLDRDDRAALALVCAACHTTVAAATKSLRIPATALLSTPGGGSDYGQPGRITGLLHRHSGAVSLSVVGTERAQVLLSPMVLLPVSSANTTSTGPDQRQQQQQQTRCVLIHPLGPPAAGPICHAALGELLAGMPSLRQLAHLDLSGVPPTAFECLPMPLLHTIAQSCPRLRSFAVSAHLWHAPVQAAVLRALLRAPAPFSPQGATPQSPYFSTASHPAMTATACQQERVHYMAAVLQAQALPVHAAREDLHTLQSLTGLTSLSITDGVPAVVLAQLPHLAGSLSGLSLDCSLLYDDGELGATLGALSGLTRLTLDRLPSCNGGVFAKMRPLVNLHQLTITRSLITAGGLTPLPLAAPNLESLQLTACPNLHSACRSQLPEELSELSRLAELYLDFELHVRDIQVLVRLPCLTALAASQLHACVSSHLGGHSFPRLRRLALHSITPDQATCLGPSTHPRLDAVMGGTHVGFGYAQHVAAGPLLQPLAGSAHGGWHLPHDHIGLLVSLTPTLRQLSIGRGSTAALCAVARHPTLQQLVLYSYGASGAADAASLSALGPVPVVDPSAWALLSSAAALRQLHVTDTDTLAGTRLAPDALLGALAAGGISDLRLLGWSAMSDASLQQTAPRLVGVRLLALGSCVNLTNAGLIALAAAPALEELRIHNCPRITDSGVAALLAAAPHLRALRVTSCPGTTAQGCVDAAAVASKARSVRYPLVVVDWRRRC